MHLVENVQNNGKIVLSQGLSLFNNISVSFCYQRKCFTMVRKTACTALSTVVVYNATDTRRTVVGFVGGGGNIAIVTALPPSSFVYCIVNIK